MQPSYVDVDKKGKQFALNSLHVRQISLSGPVFDSTLYSHGRGCESPGFLRIRSRGSGHNLHCRQRSPFLTFTGKGHALSSKLSISFRLVFPTCPPTFRDFWFCSLERRASGLKPHKVLRLGPRGSEASQPFHAPASFSASIIGRGWRTSRLPHLQRAAIDAANRVKEQTRPPRFPVIVLFCKSGWAFTCTKPRNYEGTGICGCVPLALAQFGFYILPARLGCARTDIFEAHYRRVFLFL